MADVRQTAFDIVNRLRAARTHVDVYSELRRAGSSFGYDAFMIGGLPRLSSATWSSCKFISAWPTEWEARYEQNHYLYRDPVISHIRGTADPFLWRDAAALTRDPAGMIVMNEARAFGLNEGLCVPFHQIDGSEAGVSFGGEKLCLSDDERAGLHLVAIYALSASKALLRNRSAEHGDADPTSPLTDRELECLKWSAAGKSSWETSLILSISARTVEQHLANAARKLDTVSRTQCVAEAMRRGLIE